jgi:2-polyprenyl-6-methoxyphenol hydroxylase-like FAD-dependent oxidoreductase
MTAPGSSDAPHAIVIGGSVAGLSAAIMLGRSGWRVDVYERAQQDLVNRGAGIATQDVLYAALAAAGVELRAEMGVPSSGRVMFDRDGRICATHAMVQTMTSWGLIYRFLRAQVSDAHYHRGHVLTAIESGPERVVARFENGRSAEGDWLIGADGPRSTVRQLLAPRAVLEYCGYYLWRGLIDEARVPPAVLAAVGERMMFGMAPGGHWVGYLVAGPDDALAPGARWYNWGWYRSGDADVLRDHLTDADGVHYPQGIPHDRIRPELIQCMRAEARAELAPQIQAVIEATAQPFLQGIYDGGSEQLVYGRCVLIGDAAFTARPHVGMGVCKAIEDAATLATTLSQPARPAALAEWEAARLTLGRAVLEWSRDMGSYMGPPARDPAQRAKALHYQRPEVLLAVSAASSPAVYLETA